MKMFVYLTTNLVNGKIYIGQHIGELDDDYLGSGVYFSRALSKYGRKNFKRKVLKICRDEHELNIWEYVYIKKYKSQDPNIGYNIASGDVNSSLGNPAKSKAVREKISKEMKKFWNTHPEEKRKLSKRRKGVKSSDETKKKLSKSHSGIKRTEEWRRKISESNSGENHWAYGKTFTEEHRKRLSNSIKGVMAGKNHPLWGKKMSEETRRKMSEKQKQRWQDIKKKKQEK